MKALVKKPGLIFYLCQQYRKLNMQIRYYIFFLLATLLNDGFGQTTTHTVSFEITDLTGASIKIPDPQGRLVVVNFWSVYCRVCVQEIPELNKLSVGYPGGDVLFVSVASDTKEEIKDFINLHDFVFNQARTDKRSFIDLSKLITGNIALPFTAVIDSNGKVLYQQGFVSEMNLDDFKAVIDQNL